MIRFHHSLLGTRMMQMISTICLMIVRQIIHTQWIPSSMVYS